MDSNKLEDYKSTCEAGLLQDGSVIFTSEKIFLEIMNRANLSPVIDFHDIFFDYAILILPNSHDMNNIELKKFIHEIQTSGYIVKHGLIFSNNVPQSH